MTSQAQSGGGSCKMYAFQMPNQAEAQLGPLYGQGATIVSFWVDDKSPYPFNALVCKR
jgi:hypothetical protein